jgi:two-component system NtrC family sensor kinase
VAARATHAARRTRRVEEEDGPRTLARALVSLLVRALDLERAAFLVEDEPGGTLRALATHGPRELRAISFGDPKPGGPWSLELPVPGGLLLLGRARGAALSATDLALVDEVAAGAGEILAQLRLVGELANARALLARADRLASLGTLSAGILHDIRNPLVSVRTFVQLLPERFDDPEFRTDFRELALTEIERITTLITDLLAFAGPAPSEREPTDVNELVGQIVRLLATEARKHDVSIVIQEDTALPLVPLDDARVKQVLMNVVLNAVEATGAHGRVEVCTGSERRAGREWCVLKVADSGPGILPENAAQIFEPFFTTKEGGSGLGLFIAHQIVGQHGGRIAADAREGGGTVFRIHFPIGSATDVHHDAGERGIG